MKKRAEAGEKESKSARGKLFTLSSVPRFFHFPCFFSVFRPISHWKSLSGSESARLSSLSLGLWGWWISYHAHFAFVAIHSGSFLCSLPCVLFFRVILPLFLLISLVVLPPFRLFSPSCIHGVPVLRRGLTATSSTQGREEQVLLPYLFWKNKAYIRVTPWMKSCAMIGYPREQDYFPFSSGFPLCPERASISYFHLYFLFVFCLFVLIQSEKSWSNSIFPHFTFILNAVCKDKEFFSGPIGRKRIHSSVK